VSGGALFDRQIQCHFDQQDIVTHPDRASDL